MRAQRGRGRRGGVAGPGGRAHEAYPCSAAAAAASLFREQRRDAHSAPGPAWRGGGGAVKATAPAVPGKECGPRGERGARLGADCLNGAGAPRVKGAAGAWSGAGVRRRPRVKKSGRLRARGAGHSAARPRRLQDPRAGWGAPAAWRPRAPPPPALALAGVAGQSSRPPRLARVVVPSRRLRRCCNNGQAIGAFLAML